jgi:hypothetical protein
MSDEGSAGRGLLFAQLALFRLQPFRYAWMHELHIDGVRRRT